MSRPEGGQGAGSGRVLLALVVGQLGMSSAMAITLARRLQTAV
jgi:hypothetical protein